MSFCAQAKWHSWNSTWVVSYGLHPPMFDRQWAWECPRSVNDAIGRCVGVREAVKHLYIVGTRVRVTFVTG